MDKGTLGDAGLFVRDQGRHHDHRADEEEDQPPQGGVDRLGEGLFRVLSFAGRDPDQLGARKGEVDRQHGGEDPADPGRKEAVLGQVRQPRGVGVALDGDQANDC